MRHTQFKRELAPVPPDQTNASILEAWMRGTVGAHVNALRQHDYGKTYLRTVSFPGTKHCSVGAIATAALLLVRRAFLPATRTKERVPRIAHDIMRERRHSGCRLSRRGYMRVGIKRRHYVILSRQNPTPVPENMISCGRAHDEADVKARTRRKAA
jgi:hypothetical protein